ncbi:YcaO-like family protein [Schaalia sp. 19OD2882]|uniref:YcaO-like family protein n=1 Tax=Schaalia sp. 19OD2882 TaxID=2794089 RepID=UPI001C1EBFF6|nr:YcaO-like family protein [Schaalia sp. 19OD2882]QWW19667.1 YcaO-like family protein [Schaalia sp. 19OD2882]
MGQGSGKGLVQLWPSENGVHDSCARRSDGVLLGGTLSDLEAIGWCPPVALPLPSRPLSLTINLPEKANPILVTDHPAPTSLSKACSRTMTTACFFEAEDLCAATIVLHYSATPDLPGAIKVEERALSAGASFLALFVRFPELYLGPLSSPRFPHVYKHLEARLTAASLVPRATSATLRPPSVDLVRQRLEENPDSLFEARISRTRGEGAASALGWTTINMLSALRRDRILVPWLTWKGYEDAPSIIDIHSDAFCDELAGIVTRLRTISHHEALPECVTTVQSDVTDIRVISQWSNNTVCQGSAIDDVDEARRSAVGEAIERYCVNVINSDSFVIDDYDTLVSSGLHPVAPENFVLFSPDQHAQPGFRFAPFTRSTRIPWMPAHNLTRDREELVPVSMVHVNYNRTGTILGEPVSSFPRIAPVPYAGIAAGHDTEGALVNGLEEIIERDATMIWWHSKPTINPVALSTKSVDEVVEQFKAKGFSLTFFILPNEFRIPVVAAVLRNDHHRTCNIGFSCRPTLDKAALKAVTEAATLFDGAIDLLNPEGRMFTAIERMELSPNMALPHRQDRAYLDTINWDYDSVHDLMIQQQLNLDPRAQAERSPHLDRPEVPASHYPVDEGESRCSAYYRDKLEAAGYEILTVDVTTPDIRACHGTVMRVLVPGLVPNFPAGDITLGRGRILNAYHRMGLHDRAQTPDQLNRFPLPHA